MLLLKQSKKLDTENPREPIISIQSQRGWIEDEERPCDAVPRDAHKIQNQDIEMDTRLAGDSNPKP
jgi:hypothetical protein